MGDPVNSPTVPDLKLTLPDFYAHPKRFGVHLLPDLHLNPPANPVLPKSLNLNLITDNPDGGFTMGYNSSSAFSVLFRPPDTDAPSLNFSPVRFGNPMYGLGKSLHTDLPFGLDYSASPDMSGKLYHQLNFWINKDLATVGPLGIIHQTGISNSLTDANAGFDTQQGGWMASTTVLNIDLRSKEEQKANIGTEIALGQFGTNVGPGGLFNARSYSIGSQVEIHHDEQWSLIFSGTVNFTPPDSNANGRTGFSNAMFTITFVKTHLIIPPSN
jgi:hypothetical protein